MKFSTNEERQECIERVMELNSREELELTNVIQEIIEHERGLKSNYFKVSFNPDTETYDLIAVFEYFGMVGVFSSQKQFIKDFLRDGGLRNNVNHWMYDIDLNSSKIVAGYKFETATEAVPNRPLVFNDDGVLVNEAPLPGNLYVEPPRRLRRMADLDAEYQAAGEEEVNAPQQQIIPERVLRGIHGDGLVNEIQARDYVRGEPIHDYQYPEDAVAAARPLLQGEEIYGRGYEPYMHHGGARVLADQGDNNGN